MLNPSLLKHPRRGFSSGILVLLKQCVDSFKPERLKGSILFEPEELEALERLGLHVDEHSAFSCPACGAPARLGGRGQVRRRCVLARKRGGVLRRARRRLGGFYAGSWGFSCKDVHHEVIKAGEFACGLAGGFEFGRGEPGREGMHVSDTLVYYHGRDGEFVAGKRG